jgi:isocitrate dehydrogenase
VRQSLKRAVQAKTVTYDLARQMEGAVEVQCSQFGEAMIRHM